MRDLAAVADAEVAAEVVAAVEAAVVATVADAVESETTTARAEMSEREFFAYYYRRT